MNIILIYLDEITLIELIFLDKGQLFSITFCLFICFIAYCLLFFLCVAKYKSPKAPLPILFIFVSNVKF